MKNVSTPHDIGGIGDVIFIGSDSGYATNGRELAAYEPRWTVFDHRSTSQVDVKI